MSCDILKPNNQKHVLLLYKMSLWIDPAVERALLQDYHQGQNTLNLRRKKMIFVQLR
jgi:hypothetical protein